MNGGKQDNNGSKKIQLVIKGTGIVLWEADTSQKIHSPLTTTLQGAEVQIDGTIYQISILCVPNITDSKVPPPSQSSKRSSDDLEFLRNLFDAPGDDETIDNKA